MVKRKITRDKGKLLKKSYLKKPVGSIIGLSLLNGLIIFGFVSMVLFLLSLSNEDSSGVIFYLIFGVLVLLGFGLASFFLTCLTMRPFFTFLFIYENGVDIRDSWYKIFKVKRRFLPFELIRGIEMKERMEESGKEKKLELRLINDEIRRFGKYEISNQENIYQVLVEIYNPHKKDNEILEKYKPTLPTLVNNQKEFVSVPLIKNYLDSDETILWEQKNYVDLTNRRFVVICLFVLVIILVILLLIVSILNEGVPLSELVLTIILIAFFTVVIIFVWRYQRKISRERMDKTGADLKELRNYLHFDVLTNKKYFRRSIYTDPFEETGIPFTESVDLKNNILILNLEEIDKVMLNESYYSVVFVLKVREIPNGVEIYGEDDDYYVVLRLNDVKRWDYLRKLIYEIIPSEKIE